MLVCSRTTKHHSVTTVITQIPYALTRESAGKSLPASNYQNKSKNNILWSLCFPVCSTVVCVPHQTSSPQFFAVVSKGQGGPAHQFPSY